MKENSINILKEQINPRMMNDMKSLEGNQS